MWVPVRWVNIKLHILQLLFADFAITRWNDFPIQKLFPSG